MRLIRFETRSGILAAMLGLIVMLAFPGAVGAAPSIVSVNDDSNNAALVGPPLSGHTYRVTVNVANGDPNIKDLHIKCGSGVAVGAPGSGQDVEVEPPVDFNAATNTNGYITMIAKTNKPGLQPGNNYDFTIKVNHTGGTRVAIVYTSDGDNDPTDGVVTPVANDTTVPTYLPVSTPTLGEWGMIALWTVLLVGGIYAIRRRLRSGVV